MNYKISAGRALKYLLLILISAVSLFPFLFMILGMTSDAVSIVQGNLTIGGDLAKNMTNLFTNSQNFLLSLCNSALAAIITTVLALLISSIAGYGFEVYRTKSRDLLFNILLLSMMIPFAALMIPLFRMFSNLNGTPFGLDTMFVIIVPLVSTAFLIFFFRQNTKSFPKEILEAARIDGTGELGLFFKIFMPTMKNTYAAAAIIVFMNSWNNYLWPLVAIQSPENRTVPLVLSAMGASYTPDYGMIMCGIVIATLPTAIVFFVMQKQFVQGMMGSVK